MSNVTIKKENLGFANLLPAFTVIGLTTSFFALA